MGAWGAGPFENDDAADWAFGFDGIDAAAGLALVREALLLGEGYLDADVGAVAVAAAQVVVWVRDPGLVPASAYGESIVTWLLTDQPEADEPLAAIARVAIERVRGADSELADLWTEAEDPAWEASLDEIGAALGR
jgi:hypothetical protein